MTTSNLMLHFQQFQDLSLVGKAETIQVHFTLRAKAYMSIEIIMDGKPTWIHACHTINNISWFAANYGRPCQWHNLWMNIKGLHNYMIVALDLCVKWP